MRVEFAETPSQGLLPGAMEEGLKRLLKRGFGALILLAGALGWLALIRWAPAPEAAAGIGRLNWLNIAADMLLQGFGTAAAIALFAPTFWGVEVLATERLLKPGRRLLAWPVMVIGFAGAFAALPVPQSWPLTDGLGGVAGDFVHQLVRTPLYSLDSFVSNVLAFVLLLTLGVLALVISCGIGASVPLIGRLIAVHIDTEPDANSTFASRSRHSEAAANGPTIGHRRDNEERGAAIAPSRVETVAAERASPYAPAAAAGSKATTVLAAADLSEPADFDVLDEDTDSRQIAARFAHNATARHRQRQRDSEPPPVTWATVAQVSAADLANFTPARRPAGQVFRLPGLKLLSRGTAARSTPEFTQSVLRGNARLLEDVLADFGVKGKIVHVSPGPVVTLYELEPARGVKAARVIALADDIARSMSAASARIDVVPGKNAIGIELPNIRRETVLLRELLEAEAYSRGTAVLPLALGKGISGEPVIADLARMPHLLIAGTTGSGKSVGINAMILSLLFQRTPAECRLILIDPKMLELSVYNDIPHLLTPVITDPRKAVAALEWAVGEMEERYKRMSLLNVRSIETFNNAIANAQRQGAPLTRSVQTGFDRRTGQPIVVTEKLDVEPLPYIVIVIDEMADLMLSAKQEIETAIQRLSQKARAAGIHLITATQRPSVDIVTGTIKANLPSRISYKVASKIDSRTILDEQGAEQLLGAGDLLYKPGSGEMLRLHGPFVSEDEVQDVVADLVKQGPPGYLDAVVAAAHDPRDVSKRSGKDSDDLYDRAVALVLRDRRTSIEHLQRLLDIGEGRANELIQRMEREGLVGQANGAGRRMVLAEVD